MNEQAITALINAGAAGAVIIVVLIFLRFIKERDEVQKERDIQWREFFASIRKTDGEATVRLTEVIEKLVTRVESLETRFDQHDSAEMELLRNLVNQTRPSGTKRT